LVTALIAPPVNPLWRTSKGVIDTDTCSSASSEMGEPPAGRLPPMPNMLLNAAPSTVTYDWR
jgi:hypothetical protein